MNYKLGNLDIINYYIEEYKLLKAESLQCMRNQHMFTTITITLLGIIIALMQFVIEKQCMISQNNGLIVMRTILFASVIPLVCLMVFSMYFREIIKIMVIADYLRTLENSIKSLITQSELTIFKFPFQWETEYKTNGKHSFSSALAMLLIYILSTLGGLTFSVWIDDSNRILTGVCISITVVISLAVGKTFICTIYRQFIKLERTMPMGKQKSVKQRYRRK